MFPSKVFASSLNTILTYKIRCALVNNFLNFGASVYKCSEELLKAGILLKMTFAKETFIIICKEFSGQIENCTGEILLIVVLMMGL